MGAADRDDAAPTRFRGPGPSRPLGGTRSVLTLSKGWRVPLCSLPARGTRALQESCRPKKPGATGCLARASRSRRAAGPGLDACPRQGCEFEVLEPQGDPDTCRDVPGGPGEWWGRALVSEGPEVAPVRVLVADDDASIRRMMARLLSTKASIELVGMATDAEEAVELGARTRPDVALVDVNMPKSGGVPAARELHPQSARSGDQCCRKALHFN
jgi:Response regulator receiver domain